MRRLYACILGILISSLIFAPVFSAEVRKVTRQDIEVGNPDDTVTSAGGHVGNKISNFATQPPVVDVRDHLPAGYVTNGSVDYSTQVQNTLDSMTGGQTLLVPITIGLGATGWDGLVINNKTKITIKGINGGGFIYLAQAKVHSLIYTFTDGFRITNSSYIKVEGMNFDMAGIDIVALYFDNVSYSEVINNHFSNAAVNTGKPGFYSLSGKYNNYSYNTFKKVSGGINAGGAGDYTPTLEDLGVTILGNRFFSADRSAIAGSMNTSTIGFNTFDNCNVSINLSTAVAGSTSTNVSVTGNVSRNCYGSGGGSYAYRFDGAGDTMRGIAWVGNIADNCAGGLSMAAQGESLAVGNIFRNITENAGIYTGYAGKTTQVGNILTATAANTQSGINIQGWDNTYDSDGHVVALNQIYGFINGSAIFADGSGSVDTSDMIVLGNIARGNKFGLYYLKGFDNNVISSNILIGSSQYDYRTDVAKPNSWFSNNYYGNIHFGGGDNVVLPTTVTHMSGSTISHKGQVAWSNAAPAFGVWNVGDIVYNTAADNVLGWKNTVAGTPGTWKSMTVTLAP